MSTIDYEEVGRRLCRFRNKLGITQQEFGEKTGFNNYYGRIERADDRASEQALIKLVDAINLNWHVNATLEWLLLGENEPLPFTEPPVKKEPRPVEPVINPAYDPETTSITVPEFEIHQDQIEYTIILPDEKSKIKLVIRPESRMFTLKEFSDLSQMIQITVAFDQAEVLKKLIDFAFEKSMNILR